MMGFTASIIPDWESIAIAIATLNVLLASLAIMFSRILGLKQLEQTAKNEFSVAISTVLIVFVAVSVINFVEPLIADGGRLVDISLAKALYYVSYGCRPDPGAVFPFNTLADWAMLYPINQIECGFDVFKILDYIYRLLVVPSSLSYEFFMSETASGASGFKYILDRAASLADAIIFYTIINYVILTLLQFIKYFGGYFFALGVLLRGSAETRGGGAYLMAFSLGMYFIFPLSYLLISALAQPYLTSGIYSCEIRGSTQITGISQGLFTCTLPKPTTPQIKQTNNLYLTVIKAKREEGKVMSNLQQLSKNIPTITNDQQIGILAIEDLKYVYYIATSVCLAPLVAMVITITFILNSTGIFGGNIPEVGRGLVKLI